MSRKKNIKSPWDIINRPFYFEIRELLQKENRPMTTKEIQSRLFPDWKPQRVNKYLNYLKEQGLIHRDRGNRASGKRTTYQYREFGNEQALARMRIVDYFVNGKKKHLWKAWSIEQTIKGLRRKKKKEEGFDKINIEKTLKNWGAADPDVVAAELFDDIIIDAKKKVDDIFKKCGISKRYELFFEARHNGELFYEKKF
ncbi:MAG TPA: hypothetical protein HA257_03830 [Candidatus Methanoperedenaceae archaeon]|nr:hypothetical protein [Candidatus Methanoperedenaceae archaeon]